MSICSFDSILARPGIKNEENRRNAHPEADYTNPESVQGKPDYFYDINIGVHENEPEKLFSQLGFMILKRCTHHNDFFQLVIDTWNILEFFPVFKFTMFSTVIQNNPGAYFADSGYSGQVIIRLC